MKVVLDKDYYYNDWKGDIVVCNCALAEVDSQTWFNCRYESGITTNDWWWSSNYEWFIGSRSETIFKNLNLRIFINHYY